MSFQDKLTLAVYSITTNTTIGIIGGWKILYLSYVPLNPNPNSTPPLMITTENIHEIQNKVLPPIYQLIVDWINNDGTAIFDDRPGSGPHIDPPPPSIH